MRSPYLYILIKWNTIKKHGGVLDAGYLWERNRKKREYNKPNPKRKTRNRKKKLIFCRGRGGIHPGSCYEPGRMVLARDQPAVATWTTHSSRFVLRTGTNGHSSRFVARPGRMGGSICPGCPIPVGQPGQMALKNRDERGVSLLVPRRS